MTVTTTHDPHGGGRPRLVFSMGGQTQTTAPQREFYLLPGTTRIGSDADNDLQLEDLDAHHAEVTRDDLDEYYFTDTDSAVGSTVHGVAVGTAMLRTGAIIVMGPWTVSYYREEFADHGRPYGGRQGGEFAHQRPQTEPRSPGRERRRRERSRRRRPRRVLLSQRPPKTLLADFQRQAPKIRQKRRPRCAT